LNTRDALTQKPTSPLPTIMPEAPEIASWNQIEHQSSIVLDEGVEKRIQDVKEKKNKGTILPYIVYTSTQTLTFQRY
jgi:hypothetical protein